MKPVRATSFFHLIPVALLALVIAGCQPVASEKEAGWLTLFDGKTLDGWEQHSGQAKYRVEDGAIVGQTVLNTGNSFLCTKRKFANFIFEFEFKVATNMNSGVQFRSEFFD